MNLFQCFMARDIALVTLLDFVHDPLTYALDDVTIVGHQIDQGNF